MPAFLFRKIRKSVLGYDNRPKRFVSICARKSDIGVFRRIERVAVPALLITNIERAKRIDGCLHRIGAADSSVTSAAKSFA